MDLEEFFEKIIEGYLLRDLAGMANIKASDERGGGVGYPMLQTIMSGIELLGALISKDSYKSKYGGDQYHKNFWDNVLSKYQPRYKVYNDFFRRLIRHGVAHIFITKGPIAITKENRPSHLYKEQIIIPGRFLFDGYIVDVLTFYEDFKSSYEKYIRPIVFKKEDSDIATFDNMAARLKEILSSDEEQIEKILNEVKHQHTLEWITEHSDRNNQLKL